MINASELQALIDSIHHGQISEQDLMALLFDDRGIVRANVLIALPRRNLANESAVANAVVKAALDPGRSGVNLMGTINQRKLAAATLAWIRNAAASEAYRQLMDTFDDAEKKHVGELVEQGPMTP